LIDINRDTHGDRGDSMIGEAPVRQGRLLGYLHGAPLALITSTAQHGVDASQSTIAPCIKETAAPLQLALTHCSYEEGLIGQCLSIIKTNDKGSVRGAPLTAGTSARSAVQTKDTQSAAASNENRPGQRAVPSDRYAIGGYFRWLVKCLASSNTYAGAACGTKTLLCLSSD
jgi:hypothetical protein